MNEEKDLRSVFAGQIERTLRGKTKSLIADFDEMLDRFDYIETLHGWERMKDVEWAEFIRAFNRLAAKVDRARGQREGNGAVSEAPVGEIGAA